jgi:lysophospholipase L1-like esterase
MQEVNARVQQLSHERIIYVDTATPMLGDDGKPRRELFLDDGLHLNTIGYALWTKTLRPVLGRAMKTGAGTATSQ